jgi:hypothetical protein
MTPVQSRFSALPRRVFLVDCETSLYVLGRQLGSQRLRLLRPPAESGGVHLPTRRRRRETCEDSQDANGIQQNDL